MKAHRSLSSRRRFLRAAGITGVGAALAPFLPGSLVYGQGGAPKRIVLVTLSNGVEVDRWRPRGSETDWELSHALESLGAYKDRMLVLDGVDLEVMAGPGRNSKAHQGMGVLWTGAELPTGRYEHNAGWPTAPSVDRLLAERLGGGSAMYLGCRRAGRAADYNGPLSTAHYRGGSGGRIEPILNPRTAFDGLFEGVSSREGETGVDDAGLAEASQRRRIADLLRGELSRLESQTTGLDRQVFQEHLHHMEQLDADIDRLEELARRGGSVGASCEVPSRPESFADRLENWSAVPDLVAANMQVGVRALQCDLSRVMCFQWGTSGSCGTVPFLSSGFRGGIHTRTHDTIDQPAARNEIANLTQWRYRHIKENLLDPMDAIEDVGGSLLDNSVVVIASELSAAGVHSNRNVPFVIIQGRNIDYFDTNRYKKWGSFDANGACDGCANGPHGGVPHNGVLVGLCHAMGLTDVEYVGDREVGRGVLEGIS